MELFVKNNSDSSSFDERGLVGRVALQLRLNLPPSFWFWSSQSCESILDYIDFFLGYTAMLKEALTTTWSVMFEDAYQ